MAFSIPPEREVRESVAAILRRVAAAAAAAGVEYVVGGALARDLLLFHVFGQQTTRASRDVDVMVLVSDWPVFDALKTRLVATGEFTAVPGVHQRLLHRASGTPLDLVPFGGVEEPPGVVAWPPARDVVMSVVGFEEAARAAVSVVIGGGLTVRVVALPALALLKVIAWLDRRHETDRDAIDLLMLLRLHFAAGNEDRLYGGEADLLESSGFQPELAGARLLARDAVRLCGVRVTRSVLDRMTAALRRQLEDQVLRQAVRLDETPVQDRTHELLAGFWSELTAAAEAA